MSGKRFVNYPLVVSGDLSADITSAPFNIQYLDNLGLQLIWTGTPVGTFDVQVSNNWNPQLQTGTWSSLTLSSAPAPAGSADSATISLNQVPFAWLRVKYTHSSSTGSLTVYISGKPV